MMMPSIFGENLFDDVWEGFPFNNEQFWGKKTVWKTCTEHDEDRYS